MSLSEARLLTADMVAKSALPQAREWTCSVVADAIESVVARRMGLGLNLTISGRDVVREFNSIPSSAGSRDDLHTELLQANLKCEWVLPMFEPGSAGFVQR